MQQNEALSPQSRRLGEDTDPRFSLLYRTPRTLASWRKQDEDELYGLYEDPSQASGSSNPAPSSVCPLCFGQASTSSGECTDCGIPMEDPREWHVVPLGMNASSVQTGSLLPAFGEATTDLGAPQSELEPRGSSAVLISTIIYADDDGEASQHGETVAPTTDGEGEDDGDGETDAGTEEETFYDVDPALVFAASVPLPEDDGDEYQDDDEDNSHQGDDGDGDSDYQDGGTDGDEAEDEGEADTEEEQEGAAAEPSEGEPAIQDEEDDDEDGADTPVRLSTFRHPDAPRHDWIAADIALEMIVRGKDANGHVIPAASTEAMMEIFPGSQRMIQLPTQRWKCRAKARINRETVDWEEFACGGQTYRYKNDLRRHFTQKHLGDERAEKRCKPGAKRKLDAEEDEDPDPQVDLLPSKRARLQ